MTGHPPMLLNSMPAHLSMHSRRRSRPRTHSAWTAWIRLLVRRRRRKPSSRQPLGRVLKRTKNPFV